MDHREEEVVLYPSQEKNVLIIFASLAPILELLCADQTLIVCTFPIESDKNGRKIFKTVFCLNELGPQKVAVISKGLGRHLNFHRKVRMECVKGHDDVMYA